MLALLLLLISEPSTMSSNEFDWDALMNPALQQPLQTMVSHCKPRQTVPFTSVPARPACRKDPGTFPEARPPRARVRSAQDAVSRLDAR